VFVEEAGMGEKKGRRAGSHLDLVRREAELAPPASDARFQAMADESPVILWESDANGDNNFANRTFRDFFGVTIDEVEGRGWHPLLHPEDAPGHRERFFEAVREHAVFSNEARHRRKDGEWRWLLVQARPRYAPTGAFLGHVGVCVDVTERKRAEEALRESEERYRSLFEHMNEGLAYCRMLFEGERPVDFVFLDVNPAFDAVSGLRDVVGKKVSEVLPGFPTSDPGILERYGKVARLGAPDSFETYVKSVGQWFAISVYSHAPGTFVTVFENITDRKRAEEAQHEQERRYRWLFEKSLDAVYVTRDSDGSILDANPAACALHGMSVDEIRRRGRAGLVVADDLLAEGLLRRAIHGEGRTELNLLRKDGTTFPAEVASILVGADGHEFTAFVMARTSRSASARKRRSGARCNASTAFSPAWTIPSCS
jgi:PAS domain S-box-containing protein